MTMLLVSTLELHSVTSNLMLWLQVVNLVIVRKMWKRCYLD